jgi:carboxylesterase type B
VAIGYYGYAHAEDPIVNSIAMESGNEFIDILTYDAAHGNFSHVAAHVGCGGSNQTAADELACMREVDALAIEDYIYQYAVAGKAPLLTFSPVVDNVTVFANYKERAGAGAVAKLPALIGSARDDGVAFMPYDPAGVDVEMAELVTMNFFYCPSLKAGRTRVAADTGPVYRYVYAGNFTNVSPRPWMGAWHGAELPMLFGTHPDYRGNSTALEYATSHAMQDAWLALVATAGKAMPVDGWDAWDEVDGGQVVEFGNGVPARLVDTSELEETCASLFV